MEQKINIVEQFFGLITKISEWLDKFGIFKEQLLKLFAISKYMYSF